MKRRIAAAAAALFFFSMSPLQLIAAETVGQGIQESGAATRQTEKKSDSGVQNYLQKKGDSLKDKMENVMEPMKQGEGIRGTTGES